MNYEVEQKFRVEDLDAIATRLRQLDATIHEAVEQVDRYFAHPARDFAETDEALRIRQVGAATFITYKGPKIDATTKTRREIELPLGDQQGCAANLTELLTSLGFAVVAEVRKQRRVAETLWRERTVEVALDNVDEVGRFVELELAADKTTLDAARACLASLAAELGLRFSERRSYLELLRLARATGCQAVSSSPVSP